MAENFMFSLCHLVLFFIQKNPQTIHGNLRAVMWFEVVGSGFLMRII